ncbi:hypothetical protein B5M09_007531 [Aphanomyces astaci]|uniref:Uncharacterized protein n=1 Tax=Aphanomyces astaci TaxID=112090 RepID=A0A3R7ZIG7_APHAT|nr:hypothetical protein B5M09_007531 [Aphanomyces astaci]
MSSTVTFQASRHALAHLNQSAMHVLDRKTAAVKFRTTALLSAPTAAHTAASMDALERKMHAVHSTLLISESDDFFARKLPGALTTSMAMFDRFLSSPLVVRL